MNNAQNSGDLKIIHDDGSVRIVEPDGRTSVTIVTGVKDDDKPFHVKYFASTQEVREAQGGFVARTIDPETARHICRLLIAHRNWERKKAGN